MKRILYAKVVQLLDPDLNAESLRVGDVHPLKELSHSYMLTTSQGVEIHLLKGLGEQGAFFVWEAPRVGGILSKYGSFYPAAEKLHF